MNYSLFMSLLLITRLRPCSLQLATISSLFFLLSFLCLIYKQKHLVIVFPLNSIADPQFTEPSL